MITFGDYVKPKSIEEAYEILSTKKPARILGGGCYVRMGSRRIALAVDLCDAGLDYINETEDAIELGATSTFRQIETNEAILGLYDGLLSKSVADIVGVQLRNIVTTGGTVYARHGFSDFIPSLLSMDAKVVFHNAGEMPLAEYLENDATKRDIVEKVILPKRVGKGSYQAMRVSKGDYAILVVSVTKSDEAGYRIVVGARPKRAALAYKAMEFINGAEATEENIVKAAEMAAEELTFGTNTRGSAEYRKAICKVLVKRALMEVCSC